MNTHALRSSFVIFASNKSMEAVMESIAEAMRHSRRYQQDIYDKMTTNKKVKLDVQFALKQLWQVLHCPLPATDVTYFKSSIGDRSITGGP